MIKFLVDQEETEKSEKEKEGSSLDKGSGDIVEREFEEEDELDGLRKDAIEGRRKRDERRGLVLVDLIELTEVRIGLETAISRALSAVVAVLGCRARAVAHQCRLAASTTVTTTSAIATAQTSTGPTSHSTGWVSCSSQAVSQTPGARSARQPSPRTSATTSGISTAQVIRYATAHSHTRAA